jgi:hypothetical protein
MSDRSSADWSDLDGIEFVGDPGEAIGDFSELGRCLAGWSADPLNAALNDLYLALLATPWLGGPTSANKGRARRLLSPLKWTANHQFPWAQKSFAQLPGKFNKIYEEQLRAARGGSTKGFTLGR